MLPSEPWRVRMTNAASERRSSPFRSERGFTLIEVLAAVGEAAMVDATPKDFATGLGGATITGHLYRYVTWRDENCPFALCPGNQNTKRVTVAVTLDRDPSSNERRRPMWFTTIVADPNSAPPGTLAPPGGGPSGGDPVTAHSF